MMDRRQAIFSMATALGLTLVDPSALIRSVRGPIIKNVSFVIPRDSGFLVDRCRWSGSGKVLIDGMFGMDLPETKNGSFDFLSNKIYLGPGQSFELKGNEGSFVAFDGIGLRQFDNCPVDCTYSSYFLKV